MIAGVVALDADAGMDSDMVELQQALQAQLPPTVVSLQGPAWVLWAQGGANLAQIGPLRVAGQRLALADPRVATELQHCLVSVGRPPRLAPEHALAIISSERPGLWLGRDLFGHVGLFYRWLGPDRVAFCSRLQPLRALASARQWNADYVRDHLLALPPDPHATVWSGIHRAPAGEWLHLSKGQERRLWCRHRLQALDPDPDRDWVGEFRERLDRAIRRAEPEKRRCAVLYSGGLDSASVLASTADDAGNGTVDALSARFPQAPESDELEWARRLHGRERIRFHQVEIGQLGPLAALRECTALLQEPNLLQNLHLMLGLLRVAQQMGVEHLLDGHDGDTALARAIVERRRVARRSLWSLLRRHLSRWLRGAPAAAPRTALPGYLSEDLIASTSARQRWEAHLDARRAARTDSVQAEQLWVLMGGYPSYATESSGALAAAHGLREFHPFFDPELLACCLSLPPQLRERQGLSRWVLREAMRDRLPDSLRLRPGKTSLGPQFFHLLRTEAAAAPTLMNDARGRIEAFVDLARAERDWAAVGQKQGQCSTGLWAVLGLALLAELNG